jgi:hypothetical protein
MRRLLATILLTLLLGVATSCGDPATGRKRDAEHASAADAYYQLVDGDIVLPVLEEAILPVRSKAEWSALVAKARRLGLGALEPNERRSLLSGALKAFLKTRRDIDLKVELIASGSSASAQIRESYALDAGGLRTSLVYRSVEADGVLANWGARPLPSSESASDERLFIDLTANAKQTWTRRGWSGWTCRASDDLGGYDAALLSNLGLYLGVIDATPTTRPSGPTGATRLDRQDSWGTTSYLLDTTSYWPRRIDLDALQTDAQQLPAVRINIESWNSPAAGARRAATLCPEVGGTPP